MRVTAISDTHCLFPSLPGGDLLVHAGDFSFRGRESEVKPFLRWLEKQLDLYKHIVFIAGNHEVSFESARGEVAEWMKPYLSDRLVYLEHEEKEVAGLRIFGSPYTPWFHDWAFNVRRDLLDHVWASIPKELDLLITHGPPMGIGDFVVERNWCSALNNWVDEKVHKGDESLFKALIEKKPRFHVFGHFHDGYGVEVGVGELSGVTLINAAQCGEDYKLRESAAITFEV